MTPAVVGWIVRINDGTGSLWRLDSGTGTDSNIANFKVIPADYSSGTPLVWTWIGNTLPGFLNLNQIVGLTGGGATHLDGVMTKNTFPVGIIAALTGIPGMNPLTWWQLQATTAAAVANQIVTPVDYNAVTNAVKWVLVE